MVIKKQNGMENIPCTGEKSQGNHHLPPINGHTAKKNKIQKETF